MTGFGDPDNCCGWIDSMSEIQVPEDDLGPNCAGRIAWAAVHMISSSWLGCRVITNAIGNVQVAKIWHDFVSLMYGVVFFSAAPPRT